MIRLRGLTIAERNRSLASVGIGLATVVGLLLLANAAWRLSATYDEVTYLEVASRWWLSGNQDAITRLGSPLTFWKIQQAPILWLLQALGCQALIDGPIEFQSTLLPLMRIASLWIWVLALWVTAIWARSLYGLKASLLAAWIFALSPNVLAHGSLITMEMPLFTAATAAFWLFSRFLVTGRRSLFLVSALAAGLAFACKFTAVLMPALIAIPWWIQQHSLHKSRPLASVWHVLKGLLLYGILMLATDGLLTAGATIPPSESRGEHPALLEKLGPRLGGWLSGLAESAWPQDWVAFATQMRHQRNGGPSYLLGERRNYGWLAYYPIALAVKVPLAVAVLALLRLGLRTRTDYQPAGRMLQIIPVVFLGLAMMGSTRNYGVRYLLLVAPPTIVWLSALATARGWPKILGWIGVGLLATTTFNNQPNSLSYFNELAGGPVGGRLFLADSNLDWGQGARELANLQQRHPEYQDLTTYYFGSTNPGWYGVLGIRHVVDAGEEHPGLPAALECTSKYLAVSTSLQWGPWGPTGYFQTLNHHAPVLILPGATMAIYQSSDLVAADPAKP